MKKCPKCGYEAPAQTSENVGELLDLVPMDGLKDFEEKFVSETRTRFEKYGANTMMSEKQLAWLRKLAAR